MMEEKQYEQALADLLDQMRRDGEDFVSAAMLAATGEVNGSKLVRQVIERAAGGWRSSTLFGYMRGSDSTFKKNFRMAKHSFDHLCDKLRHSGLAPRTGVAPDAPSDDARARRRALALLAYRQRDVPSLRFRVATCLYAMGNGGRLKVCADVASIGEATIRRWLHEFSSACMLELRTEYMPCTPMSPDERTKVSAQFAARRGMQHVVLACDGSHIPFRPKNKENYNDYKNYKGWTSMLAVAFVDSFYRFHEVQVGAPGRSGDNTVLRSSWFMEAIRDNPSIWLGEHGVILGDSGASDGDAFFLNPYHSPSAPEQCWFNFCHSSSRFFVE